jgi:AraC family transcriptional regulator of adaptative response/methylated-DNA-[protein]-cysteine methyltransferase
MNIRTESAEQNIHYKRIADAISFVQEHFREQPSLEMIAEHVHLSPFHFQKLFTEWAGISPKKFLQYTSIQYARELLKERGATLFDAAHETGLSGTGRLHDLFVNIEGMTPGEYKNGGETLNIDFSFAESPFGGLIVASTPKGISYMAFYETEDTAFVTLQAHFPKAEFTQRQNAMHSDALGIFSADWDDRSKIKLHLKGTPFQLKVWETLLKIPTGHLSTYGNIAESIRNPSASRAVGTAIGSNPVTFLIPCHRVIQSSGQLGGYMWGTVRKTAMIGWEAAMTHPENP